MKQELAQIVDKLQQFNMEGDSEEYCTVRHFSISGRKVVNRGDSFKAKTPISRGDSIKTNRSSSRHSIASMDSSGCIPTDSPRLSPTPPPPDSSAPFTVAVLGGPGVGKSSLVSQFMTSDFLHAYESFNCDRSEKTVTVLLDGEESELTFSDLPYALLQRSPPQDAYLVVYSVTDRRSFHEAQLFLQTLICDGLVDRRAVILVANKVDLARCTVVSEQEGRILATASNCKYIESSVVINHHVDELLVGLVTQIRLRSGVNVGSASKTRRRGGKYRGSKTSSSFRGLLSKLRIAKSQSCHKLHVL